MTATDSSPATAPAPAPASPDAPAPASAAPDAASTPSASATSAPKPAAKPAPESEAPESKPGPAPEPEAQTAPASASKSRARGPHSSRPFARLSPGAAKRWENELRGRLGLLPTGYVEAPAERKRGWIITGVIALVAAIARLFRLSHPHELVFDETYYVKEAFSFLNYGYEGKWADDVNAAFVSGDYSGLDLSSAEYVVHPPLGKWLLALGQAIFGSDSGLGWRFASAAIGILAVVLVVRIALRLFRSPLLAALAGLAVALDGMGIVMSRTGLLDNFLAFFILAGFWAVVRDREHSRAQLAHAVAHGYLTEDGKPRDVWGPALFYRPWLLVAGVLLGMSTAVKWSGIYAVAVFGILVFVWGIFARRAVGAPLFLGGAVFREGWPAFVQLVPVAGLTYVACWASWFLEPRSWGRDWAASASEADLPISWAPNIVNSWLHYHGDMWRFHNGLETPHTYQSKPWVWILQQRPVSFYWKGKEEMKSVCPDSECVQAITSIGNIAVWWIGLIAIVAVIALGIQKRDWRAGAILAGYAATWLPWFMYAHRTVFQFYAIALLPFVAFALAWAIGAASGMLGAPFAQPRPIAAELAGFEGAWLPGIAQAGKVSEDETRPDFPAFEEASAGLADEAAGGDAVGADAFVADASGDDAPRGVESDGPRGSEARCDGEAQGDGVDLAVAGDAETEQAATAESEQSETNVYARAFAAMFGAGKHMRLGGAKAGWWSAEPTSLGLTLSTTLAILIVAAAVFWYPLWIGSTVSYDFWHAHMFFSSWI